MKRQKRDGSDDRFIEAASLMRFRVLRTHDRKLLAGTGSEAAARRLARVLNEGREDWCIVVDRKGVIL